MYLIKNDLLLVSLLFVCSCISKCFLKSWATKVGDKVKIFLFWSRFLPMHYWPLYASVLPCYSSLTVKVVWH